jgi:hypothetical protein
MVNPTERNEIIERINNSKLVSETFAGKKIIGGNANIIQITKFPRIFIYLEKEQSKNLNI